MQIAIPIYPRLTALDAIGPYETLQRLPGVSVAFCWHERGEIRTENDFLGLIADTTFAEVPNPDVVVVPGGVGCRETLDDRGFLDWLTAAHQTAKFTTSVCTGSLILGAAGLLRGLTATTYWGVRETLRSFGAEPVDDRVVEHLDQRILTAAGVSSGIDMALRLAELLFDQTAAEAMQLGIEYDPQPPFEAGAPWKASDEVKRRLAEYSLTKQ
ncbi:MAG: DJ-1/PfpI family protein [Nocardioides sp.]